MLKCWSYRPEERPTFRYCLEVLQLLRNNCEAVHINMQNSNRTLINGENIILLCKKHLYSTHSLLTAISNHATLFY